MEILEKGKCREGKNLDDYEFYPFDLDEKKNLFLDVKKFNAAVTYFISRRDNTAARQLILIGEQNYVEDSCIENNIKIISNFFILLK